jgi:hypothetical protein
MKDIARATGSAVAVLAIAACAGCGGTQAPRRAQTDAISAVTAARAVGAAQEPNAAYHLKLADAQIDDAKRRIANGDMVGAQLVLRQAEADAELAIALTREAQTRRDAEATRAHIESMRSRYLQGGAS